MIGFEPRTSGIGSDHSTNWATTTAQENVLLVVCGEAVESYLDELYSVPSPNG